MIDYVFLDDSLQIHDDLYVYSHALVINSENIETLVITGSKDEVYNQESRIYDFLCDNIGLNDKLIACRHYEKYISLSNDLIFSYFQFLPAEIFNSKKKYFKKMFNLAHETAKHTAKEFSVLELYQ